MTNTHTDAQRLLKTFLRDVAQKTKVNEALETNLTEVKPDASLTKIDEIPFSSERKFSACLYQDRALVLGAPEVLLSQHSKEYDNAVSYQQQSYRVVTFGESKGSFSSKEADEIKKKFTPQAVIALEDPIREEAKATLAMFLENNIHYKIISGDAKETVVAIAKRINDTYPALAITGQELEELDGEKKREAIITSTIFSRIKPHQKQEIIRTLKADGQYTVMIGDGVNDVLALKEAHVGVAMNGGSNMAKDVAEVVLLNNSFATLPELIIQGRRIIANIQTIANLYLIKNISSISAILMLGFIGLRFPFDPKHVEYTSLLIIGVPSIMLAFDVHTFPISDKGFMSRLLQFSGIVGFGDAILYTILYTYYDIMSEKLLYSRTILVTAVILLGICNIVLIYLQYYSIREIIKRPLIIGLLATIALLFVATLLTPLVRSFLEIEPLGLLDSILVFGVCVTGSLGIATILNKRKLIRLFE